MDEAAPRNKKELLQHIQGSRDLLEKALSRLTDAQRVAAGGASGWSVKDHLAHIAAWELSLAALLKRRPRHAAMGLDEATYERGPDTINEAVYERSKERSLAEVQEDFRQAHERVLAAIEELSDADLRKTYSHFQPDEPGEDSGEPIVEWIAGNTYDHYDEHLAWFESLPS